MFLVCCINISIFLTIRTIVSIVTVICMQDTFMKVRKSRDFPGGDPGNHSGRHCRKYSGFYLCTKNIEIKQCNLTFLNKGTTERPTQRVVWCTGQSDTSWLLIYWAINVGLRHRCVDLVVVMGDRSHRKSI